MKHFWDRPKPHWLYSKKCVIAEQFSKYSVNQEFVNLIMIWFYFAAIKNNISVSIGIVCTLIISVLSIKSLYGFSRTGCFIF